ncbi:hypothetical protein G1H11_23770 [Phytoactinopolyspora alkaliphila]|uniref:Uncharacterized protein n=1 Tax=Phytoactinopolyspora alkaliphila TaxID=1783498 RepID=A0A6N9YTF1_9ACTN|nr:hypothetical protein [Phytoactinopolyspora alkaliphila]
MAGVMIAVAQEAKGKLVTAPATVEVPAAAVPEGPPREAAQATVRRETVTTGVRDQGRVGVMTLPAGPAARVRGGTTARVTGGAGTAESGARREDGANRVTARIRGAGGQ